MQTNATTPNIQQELQEQDSHSERQVENPYEYTSYNQKSIESPHEQINSFKNNVEKHSRNNYQALNQNNSNV